WCSCTSCSGVSGMGYLGKGPGIRTVLLLRHKSGRLYYVRTLLIAHPLHISCALYLANICLPHVLDEWVEHEGRPRRQGRGFLPRFADDCVMGCAKEADARKLMDVLPKRVARFGLTMHPTKTALLACPKPGAHGASTVANGTFDFRGLPPYGA